MPKVITFITNDSPQTFGVGGDDTSQYYILHRADGLPEGPVSIEASADASPGWNGVSLLVETCLDLTVSPQRWATETTKTAPFIYHFSPAPGAAIRVRLTGSGSPEADITVQMRGDFDGQTGT